ETSSSGVPPIPTPPANSRLEPSARQVAQPQRESGASPNPQRRRSRNFAQKETVPSSHAADEAPRKATQDARPEESALAFGQRLGTDTTAASSSKAPVRYHVETGARIRVTLDVNLDTRTVSAGPAAVRL